MMPAVPARVDLATPAEPDQGLPSATRARLKAAALGVVGSLLVPLPAAAAPAPCDQPLRYAAQSGSQVLRIGSLDLSSPGRPADSIKNIGVGEVKSALVAQSPINSAALGRMLDSAPPDRQALAEVLKQTAPPSHDQPDERRHEAAKVGPFRLGASSLNVHARWEPRMACGNVAGEATRAEAEVRRAGVLGDGDGALVRVPGKISGLSTTAMELRGKAARAVAEASMAGGKIELLGGAVTVRILKTPSLLATMSGADGGEVRYKPAVVEVSGEGFGTARLDMAGDVFELRLDEDGEPVTDEAARDGEGQDGSRDGSDGTGEQSDDSGGASKKSAGSVGSGNAGGGQDDAVENSDESGRSQDGLGSRGVAEKAVAGFAGGERGRTAGSAGQGGAAGIPIAEGASTDNVGKLGAPVSNPDNSGTIGGLAHGAPLPVPSLPGVPVITVPDTEAAPAAGTGTSVKISLGDVRQAVAGHAIAAKATSIKVAITQAPDRQAYAGSTPTALTLGLGLLEVAAVAPEPAGGSAGAVSDAAAGLPITGPRVDVLALSGLALLIAGAAALIFGMRGRYRS
jgi:hypothetical protein